MRLKISRKKGIRLYINNRRYIKVHNILMLLGGITLGVFLVVNTIQNLTHECKHVEESIEIVFQEFPEQASEKVEEVVAVEEVEIEEPVKPAYTGVCSQYYDMVDKYDWDTETMLAIMYAESSCRPNLDNTGLNKNGSVDYGLFQINSIHGYDKNDLMDPEFNISVAYKIYKSQGLRAWSVYNSGKYLQYLNS